MLTVVGISAAEWQDRLAACALVRTRFRGRADLEALADRGGDEVALVRLEARLGLAGEMDVLRAERARVERDLLLAAKEFGSSYTIERGCGAGRCTPHCRHGRAVGYLLASPEAREAWAARDYATAGEEDAAVKALARHVAPRRCDAIDTLRAERTARRPEPAPKPGRILRKLIARELKERVGQFRAATHSHEWSWKHVPAGSERADSKAGQARPQDVGLPNAYAKKAFFVSTSEHRYQANEAILTPEVRLLNEGAPAGVLYLAVDRRVRQGRGTSLVTEIRTSSRGGWTVLS